MLCIVHTVLYCTVLYCTVLCRLFPQKAHTLYIHIILTSLSELHTYITHTHTHTYTHTTPNLPTTGPSPSLPRLLSGPSRGETPPGPLTGLVHGRVPVLTEQDPLHQLVEKHLHRARSSPSRGSFNLGTLC